MSENIVVTSSSAKVEIFMAGDVSTAKQVCREWTYRVGGCVTVTETTYVYTGGEESGFVIGFINYPRFPKEVAEIVKQAKELADLLMVRCCQNSYTLYTPDVSEFLSRKKPND